jgi:hypothetical protein
MAIAMADASIWSARNGAEIGILGEGTEVDVLEEDPQWEMTFVRAEDGTTGWVLTDRLIRRSKRLRTATGGVVESTRAPGTAGSRGGRQVQSEQSTGHIASRRSAPAPFEYHVVPFIGRIRNSTFSKDNAETVSAQLHDLIAGVGAQGWEFYRVDQVQIAVAPGCLGFLFGRRTEVVSFDQVIFRRPVA